LERWKYSEIVKQKLKTLVQLNENEYNHCYLHSLGGRQLCQNFELNDMSHPSPELPWCQISTSYAIPLFNSGQARDRQTNGQTDRQTTVIIA